MKNHKIYSPWYIQFLKDEDTIRQSQTVKTDINTNDQYDDSTSSINTESKETEKANSINLDTVFKPNMYEKFLSLEEKLISDEYLDDQLCWLPTHSNSKPDIQRLVIFLIGLIDNQYFLSKREPRIRKFFEHRYSIEIGQNFELGRRKNLSGEYQNIFYDYNF